MARIAAVAGNNLEIVKAGYEAFLRGDLEAAFSSFAPDIEAVDDPMIVGERHYTGVEGFARMLVVTTEGFEDVRYFADEFREFGDRVLVKARRSGRGQRSGVTVEERQYHLWTSVGGRTIRFELFHSEAEALKAARSD